MVELGRLESIDLRTAWKYEAKDFTPWLSQEDNLQILGDTLGIEFELVATEKNVGPFSADIVCRDTADGSYVLIENQLEKTDHTHLGQILTYAAGLSAVQVIWVAKRFTDEHRAALDWLNEHTNENLNFFGVEVQLWKIGGSLPAPRFNVISKPNDWVKRGGPSATMRTELTETRKLQQAFWDFFHEYCLDGDFSFKPTKPHPQHWMSMAVGRTGFGLTAVASSWSNQSGGYGDWEIRAEFVCYDSNVYLEALQEEWSQVENDLGFPLTWRHQEGKKQASAAISTTIDLSDRDNWPKAADWLARHLDRIHQVLSERVKALP